MPTYSEAIIERLKEMYPEDVQRQLEVGIEAGARVIRSSRLSCTCCAVKRSR